MGSLIAHARHTTACRKYLHGDACSCGADSTVLGCLKNRTKVVGGIVLALFALAAFVTVAMTDL